MEHMLEFTSTFKANIALEAIKEKEPDAELAKRHNLPASKVTEWKNELLTNAELAFEKEGEIYNILWLDDDFEESSSAGFREHVEERAKDYPKCKIQQAKDKAIFEGFFAKGSWDAVVLDIYGILNTDDIEPNSDTFREALKVVRDKCPVVIAYSGEFFEDKRAGERRLIQGIADDDNVEIVRKSRDPKMIFEKILNRIETPFRIYFPESKAIEKYLSQTSAKYFRYIQASYNENAHKFKGFTEDDFEKFRKFAESIFINDALERGMLKEIEVKSKENGNIQLGTCLKKMSAMVSQEESYYKAGLLALNNLINVDSHADKTGGKAYVENGKYRFHAFINSLCLSLKWYYRDLLPNSATKDMPKSTLQEGEVCKDEDGNIFLGNVLLPPKAEGWVGKKIRLKNITENTNKNTNRKYPLFALHFDPVEN